MDKPTYVRKIWKMIIVTAINVVYISAYTRTSHNKDSKVDELIWENGSCDFKVNRIIGGRLAYTSGDILMIQHLHAVREGQVRELRVETSWLVWEV